MQQVKVGRSGSGQLYIYIPKFIENHFGMQAGQKVWVRIEGNGIRISFENHRESQKTAATAAVLWMWMGMWRFLKEVIRLERQEIQSYFFLSLAAILQQDTANKEDSWD